MIVLGLTGSIGMGKSAAAQQIRRLGVPVFDADAAVHRLLAKGGGGVVPIASAFPGMVVDGEVDRARLGAMVFGDPTALARLEAILHPMVGAARQRFLRTARRRRSRLVVLDIPLLFESGNDRLCDRVAVVSCPAFLQRQRVLARPRMTKARLAAINARQMPDVEKRKRADYVVPTGAGLRNSLRHWVVIMRKLTLGITGGGRRI